jgi:glutaredoxin 3
MKVSVYSTPTCPWCVKVKDFLKENHIEFTSIDVSEDREKAQEMIDKTGQMGVPVTMIQVKDDAEEVQIIGYDEKAMKKALHLK